MLPPQNLLVLPGDDQAVEEDTAREREPIEVELWLQRKEVKAVCKNEY